MAPSSGRPLDDLVTPDVAASLSRGLGGDLQDVRLHTDEAAANASANINARAFSLGPDIYFGRGELDASSTSGVGLLAHELAHVVEPRSGSGTEVRRQPRTKEEETEPGASAAYPEEPALLRASVAAAKVGGLSPGTSLGSGQPPARAIAADILLVGPLTSDMGPIYYVYRFGGRDAKNLSLATRSSVVPADWSSGPTSDEVSRARGGVALHVVEAAPAAHQVATSKQQLWEQEFQREYPSLRDVGGGGDPWGATDEGVMTETGVRVPRETGHTLLRRPFYEHRLAAFFAYQGFIHYAELLEAGEGKTALKIGQSLYARTGQQVPKDKDLDLWEQTHWARRAAAARQTVEFGMLAAEVAIAAGRAWSALRSPGVVDPTPAPSSQAPAPPTLPPPTPSAAASRVQVIQNAEAVVAQSNAAVEQAVRSQNAAYFQGLGMSQSQIRKVLDPTHRMFKAEYGNAMERATARGFAQDPVLSGSVRHIGSQRGHVAGTGKPDFVIDQAVWGHQQFMDVTTTGARAAHVLRDYGKRVLQLVYDIPAFP